MSPTSYDHYHAASHWPPDETFLLLPQQSWMQPSSHGGSPYHSMPTSGFGFHQPYAAQVADAYERPIRKKRASKPKVRTGCTTCKVSLSFCNPSIHVSTSQSYHAPLGTPTFDSPAMSYNLTSLPRNRYGVSNAMKANQVVSHLHSLATLGRPSHVK